MPARILAQLTSAKVALPVLLATAAALAYGSFLEARYDSELARLWVYRAPWFGALLGLVGVEIALAMLSCRPFKASDAGVLVGQAGLLVLLLGALVTRLWRVDRELTLQVGAPGAAVAEVHAIARGGSAANVDAFADVNRSLAGVHVAGYLPFARATPTFKRRPPGGGGEAPTIFSAAVLLHVESPFGDTDQWLSSSKTRELQLGPARAVLVLHPDGETGPADPSGADPDAEAAYVEIHHAGSEQSQRVPVAALAKGPVDVEGLEISLVRALKQAVVSTDRNQLAEGGQPGGNPALELSIKSGGQTAREVLYAKFPEFTLSPGGVFGRVLRYVTPQRPTPAENVAELHVFAGAPDRVQVRLLKSGTELLSQWMKPTEILPTPWMGIRLSVREIVLDAAEDTEVAAAGPEPGRKLPGSALRIELADGGGQSGFWLMEGQSRVVSSPAGPLEVRYGPRDVGTRTQQARDPGRGLLFAGGLMLLCGLIALTMGGNRSAAR